jgi:AcrR family transcriptional regulator
MTSLRHNLREVTDPHDELLDAARDCILAVGVRRTTLTDVARRANVSRMTLYRRWPDVQSLLSDLMTREWAEVAARAIETDGPAPGDQPTASSLSTGVTAISRALRANRLFRKILDVDPELMLPYLLQRRGRSQDALLAATVSMIEAGQQAGTVREGDPRAISRTMLLAAQGHTLSMSTMTDGVPAKAIEAELQLMLERYLTP